MSWWRGYRLGMWLLATLLTSGCDIPGSEQPTVDPAEAKAYPELFGTYRNPLEKKAADSTEDSEPVETDQTDKAKNPSPEFLHLGGAGSDFPPGFVRLVTVEHQEGVLSYLSVIGFFDKLGDDYLFHLPMRSGESQGDHPKRLLQQDLFWPDGWDASKVEGYLIMRFRYTEGRLYVGSFMDGEFVAAEIEAGRLTGEVKRNDDPRDPFLKGVWISAESAELRAFIERHIEGKLFDPIDENKYGTRID